MKHKTHILKNISLNDIIIKDIYQDEKLVTAVDYMICINCNYLYFRRNDFQIYSDIYYSIANETREETGLTCSEIIIKQIIE